MKSYKQQQKEEETKPRTMIVGCIYVAIVVAVSFILAGLVMEQFDLFNELGIRDIEIPLINYSLKDMPEWALQVALTALIFFILQPLVVIVVGVFSRGNSRGKSSQPPPNPWES